VSELDEAWALALAEAERRARGAGRGEIADYLALRASNDLARRAGIQWLLDTFSRVAGEANRAGGSIQMSRQEAHRFGAGHSTMVGSALIFRLGVRELLVEAGWPRAPRDGFVRGGGLALANIKHLGKRASDEELMLVRSDNGTPQWLALEKTGARRELAEESVRLHIARFLGT
jgi:hypothetical protein